jgi:hypothetical protein
VSRVLSGIGKVAGVVAAVAMVIPGGQPIAAIASLVALTANVGAAVTAKKPPARGSTSQVMIGANMPMPYTMGRTYVGGARVHDVGYGGTVNKVVNPYRSMVDIYSAAGPIDSIEGTYSDFTLITFSGGNAAGYYNNFMYRSTQLGASPEGSALAGPFGSIPNWGAPYNLSGFAAALYSLKYDKDGKKFSSGVPQLGAVIKGVMVYDPRLDTTYPGGAGSHDFDDESTWEWSENPALHALAYARGRYQNGKKVIGCGFSEAGIDIAAFVELANICDANGWTLGGTIYEPGSKWDNLKRILATAAAEPVFVGARLSVRFNAPRIALDTITADDLADGEYIVPAMKTWRDRINGIIPRYRSETHKWEYVQSDLVTVAGYVTEDGEEKQEERQFDLVQDKDQAAQLAAYELVNGREFGPIVLQCKPRMIEYVPGEALEIDIPELGLNGQLCIITGRRLDPGTAMVELTLESETTTKHAYALGRTGTAPPTPTITSGADMDDVVGGNSDRQVSIEAVPSLSFAADYQGTVTSPLLPFTIYPIVNQGGVSIKLDDATEYALANSGVTATVNSTDGSGTKGNIEITALTANSGYIDLTVAVGGVAYPTKRIIIAKSIGLPPSLGGAGAKIASDNSFSGTSSTSYSVISDVVTVTLATGESLYGTAPLDYIPETGGGQVTRTATAKWEYSVAGAGVWSDFAAGITGSTSRSADLGEPEYGHVDCNQTKSGLAAGNYDVRLSALVSASGRAVGFTGTATVEAKT